MKRRSLVTVASLALLVVAILPALAASVDPVRVGGSSNCASVGSTGDFSLKIEPVATGTYTGPGGVEIEIILDGKMPHTFGFIMDGGLAHDVLVKGSASNHYDYAASEGGPTDSDFGLTKPNGNSLKHAIFCYDVQTFTISGTKFEDLGEGEIEALEVGGPGLEGWTIVLDGETSTVTGEDGSYTFEGVSAGSHEVCEVQKDGWTQTFPSEGACHTVDTSGGDVTDVDFGNQFQGDPIECGGSVSTESGETSASFTRLDDGDCNPEELKSAFVNVEEGDEGFGDETIVFVPRGEGTSNYEGTLSFVKAEDDPNLLVLQYDPDSEGPEGFRDMQACIVTQPEGFEFTIPDGETWCYFGVELSPNSQGLYRVTWQVLGTGDPRFK
jgi:hypothetical protein